MALTRLRGVLYIALVMNRERGYNSPAVCPSQLYYEVMNEPPNLDPGL